LTHTTGQDPDIRDAARLGLSQCVSMRSIGRQPRELWR
jgi:hypothetical protein